MAFTSHPKTDNPCSGGWLSRPSFSSNSSRNQQHPRMSLPLPSTPSCLLIVVDVSGFLPATTTTTTATVASKRLVLLLLKLLLVRQGGLHRLMLEVDAVLVPLVVVGADHLGASDDATTANTTADPRCFKVWTTPKRPPDNNHRPGRRTGRWKWKKNTTTTNAERYGCGRENEVVSGWSCCFLSMFDLAYYSFFFVFCQNRMCEVVITQNRR